MAAGSSRSGTACRTTPERDILTAVAVPSEDQAARRYVRGSEGLVPPNLGTHELTRVARVGRAEPHAKEDGPWTTIAWLTSALTRPRPSTPWPSRGAAA